MITNGMSNKNFILAKSQVKYICNKGISIKIYKASKKDEFGEITSEVSKIFKSFPIRYTPYDRKVEAKITWAPDTDCLAYVSKLAVDDMGLDINDLKTYEKMEINGKTYDLRYVEPYSQFANDYLYVVFGGKI
jgi:hypothetical protein